MILNTPISVTSNQALSRVLNFASKGYERYLMGSIPSDSIADFVDEVHNHHGIYADRKQRAVRKKMGKANALLTIYHPESSTETAD